MTDNFIHPSSFIDQPCKIGNGVKIWHFCHLMPNCVIGDNCTLGQNVFVGSNVILGENVKVQNGVLLYDGVTIENGVFLGPAVVFTNVINPRSKIDRKNQYRKTLVKEGASIGANATIICGNSIGRFAFVGAGSVVTKDIADYALVIGNPARQIGWVSEAGIRLHFKNDKAICLSSNESYLIENGKVRKI